MPGKDKNRGSKRFMDAIKKGQEFSASMKVNKDEPFSKPSPTTGPSATPRNKKIPEGNAGKGLKALPPSVVEKMGYAATTRLNPLMQLETMRPMNPMGAAAISGPNTMPNPNMVLRRASKMSNTEVKPISTRYKQGKRRIPDKDLYKLKKVY